MSKTNKTDERPGPSMFLPCPCNPVFHRQPVALPIRRGPKAFFVRCECGFRGYMPPSWTSLMGLTEEQALRAGLLVMTSNIR